MPAYFALSPTQTKTIMSDSSKTSIATSLSPDPVTPTPPPVTSRKVLITGATGATGSHAIARLLELHVPMRALVHKLDVRSKKLSAQGVEIIQGDLSDFAAVSEALEGVTGAYFVYPVQVPGILEATAFFAQAALEQGVGAIVNMSQITARRVAKSHAARNHWIAERLLDRSGIAVTHLRPTFFAEWLMYQAQSIREKNILPLPFGDARYAPIAAEDQGRVIATILKDPAEHAGRTYPLYGPKELNQFEIAEILSEVLGRKITYAPLEIKAFEQVLDGMGFNPHFIQHISAVAQDCRDGVMSGTNDLVEQLTGRKPLAMVDYILKNNSLFNQRADLTVNTPSAPAAALEAHEAKAG
jgi:NAD(P)H dehydrogenase (quinone)